MVGVLAVWVQSIQLDGLRLCDTGLVRRPARRIQDHGDMVRARIPDPTWQLTAIATGTKNHLWLGRSPELISLPCTAHRLAVFLGLLRSLANRFEAMHLHEPNNLGRNI